MFITKKHIPRRTFLRGAGTTLALPFLESMLPAQTPLGKTAAAPGAVRRFLGIWHPHGAAPGYWSPLQEGKDFEFSFITKPLEPFRNHVVLISGLNMNESFATEEEPGGDHAKGAALLSGARPRRNAVSPYLGVTIDQLIAEKYGRDTILSSIQLGVEDTTNFGNCNWGYSCAYTNSISWPNATTPLPTEINPRIAFERLFGDGSRSERVANLKRREYEQHSILDYVMADAKSLNTRLDGRDRQKLDQYFTSVREIEQRIAISKRMSVPNPDVDAPEGVPASYEEHVALMFDMVHLAFQTDSTRIATLLLAREGSNRPFNDIGISSGHHDLSHHKNTPDIMAKVQLIDKWYVQRLAAFLEKMDKTQDVDGPGRDAWNGLRVTGSNQPSRRPTPCG